MANDQQRGVENPRRYLATSNNPEAWPHPPRLFPNTVGRTLAYSQGHSQGFIRLPGAPYCLLAWAVSPYYLQE